MRGMQPKKDHTVLIALSVLVAVMMAGGGAWLLTRDSSEPRSAPLALPSHWPNVDGETVRQVPLPTGEMAAAMPAHTEGHVLCSAVPEQTWASALGGPILREVGKYGACHVVSANVDVTALTWDDTMVQPGANPEPVVVAGRQATVAISGSAPDRHSAALLTVRLAETKAKWARPNLQLRVNRVIGDRAEHDFRGMALSLGAAMVGAITSPGPALPADGESREMTPIPGSGITDAATPLITWQLCTQLSRALNIPLDQLEPGFFGSCQREEDLKTIRLVYHDEGEKYFPDRIAGRPAREKTSDTTVEIQLLDDSRQTLEITWIDSTKPDDSLHQLAEKVVPPLLGR
jgi:hypothetical protein